MGSITVEGGNSVYDSRNNCNAIIETGTNTLIEGCKNSIIPNSVTCIVDFAFFGSSLTSITIPNSVTRIGDHAFRCSSLTSITIPNSVTRIGDYVFSECSHLTSITIPNSVTSIGDYAFYECYELASVTCLADTPPAAYSHTFYDVDKSSCTLYVKKNTASLYASAVGWSDFINIVEIDDENMDINPIQADPSAEMVYDLSGNRVQQVQKGRTYIRNGKKILVK